jgi:hypothetical protein
MEISLEKIELVKDRTGVSYREAKDALYAENGSVVDAIIRIEDQVDIAPKTAAENAASDVVEKLKEMIRKGNVARVVVKRENDVILSIPVTIGVIGAVLLPEAAIFSAIVALGVKCSISILTKDGQEVDVVKKAREKISDARENYSSVADGIREKGGDALNRIKEKADSVISRTDLDEDEPFDDDYFNFDDDYPDIEDLADPKEEDSVFSDQDVADAAAETEELIQEMKEGLSEAKDALFDNELLDESDLSGALDQEEDTSGQFEEAISDFKARRKRFFNK